LKNNTNPRAIPKLTLSFIAGIVLAYYIQLPLKIFLIGILISLSSGIYFFTKENASRFFIAILVFFFCFGFLWTSYYQNRGKELYIFKNTVQNISGMILKNESYQFGSIYRLTDIKINGKKFSGDLSLLAYDSHSNFKYGDVIQFEGKLEVPGESRNPGQFNLKKYLQKQGIVLQTKVNESDIKLIGKEGNLLFQILDRWRVRIQKLADKALKERERAIFNAMILGDKKGLSDTSRELFMQFGLMHLLAVSGLHTGFVILFLIKLCKILKLNLKWEFVACSLGLFLYSAITGFAPPVVRATIMAIIYLLGKMLNQQHKLEEMLALAALILLVTNPLQLFTASFQLTFVATMGILYLTPIVETVLEKFTGNDFLKKIFSVPFAAFFAVTPLTAFYFNRVSLLGPFTSIFLTPIAGLVVILGIIALVFSFLPLLSIPLFFLNGGMIYLILEILAFTKKIIPGEVVWIVSPSLPAVFTIYVFMVGVFFIFKYREEPKLIIVFRKRFHLIVCILLIILLSSILLPYENNLQVTFLDVGQGDAIYIKTPAGKSVLLDGGVCTEYQDMGKTVVLPYLRHLGREKIDVIINSHPDNDHLGGLFTVVREITSHLVLLPDIADKSIYKSFLDILHAKKIKYAFVAQGDILKLDDNVLISFLYPPSGSNLSPNNSSLVVKVSYGESDFLLTGDIEKEGQKILCNGSDLSAEVLKVSHHGSNDSFDVSLLKKINPQVAVISVGENNRFGHPGEKILNWSKSNGIKLYRTDKNGAVTIKSDGKSLQVQTMLKPAS